MTANAHSEFPGGRSSGAVFFALGLAGVPPAPALPGAVLVRLLGDLGQGEAAARATILRMRRAGLLTSTRIGRAVTYAPSAAVVAGQARHRNQFVGTGPAWDGAFHALLVTVPERARAFRDEVRRSATRAGYRTLRSGLLIAPSDRMAELEPALDRLPPGASLVVGRLQLSTADTRQVAAELWRLDELAARYRALVTAAQEARQAATRRPPAGSAAVQAFASAALPIYQAIADDPGLPADLLPRDWPGTELGRALGRVLRTFGPAVAAYVDHLRRAD